MGVALVILAVIQVFAAYFCARCVYRATCKKWLSVVLVLMSALAPFSFGFFRNSLKCTCILEFLCNLSHFWLGFILYFFFSCCGAFLLHKVNSNLSFKKLMACGAVATLLVLIFGFVNAMNPQLKKIEVPSTFNLRVCFISDIHVGSIGTACILEKISDLIELVHPDLIILGGDILDLNGVRNHKAEFLSVMRKITDKYKTYAVIGNHEVYTGVSACVRLMNEAGITVLLDACLQGNYKVDLNKKKLMIVGRLDSSIPTRKNLEELMKVPDNISDGAATTADVFQKSIIIVVDHSPESINESINEGVLLHLSGHTHGGQMFPLNFLTGLLYKKTGVLLKDRGTYSYISFGAGFWGPPYRVGNTPEVVLIEFKKH